MSLLLTVGPTALAVHDASCTGFRSQIPVRLFVSGADEQVPAANSEHCRAVRHSSGVDAQIVDVGNHELNGSTHLGANVEGTALAVRWFAELA